MAKASVKQQIEQLTRQWQRAVADYQNLERRCQQEKADFVDFANAGLISKLLEVLDHLKRAQRVVKDEGLNLAIKEFENTLTQEGLVEIKALGQDFDPITMEAIGLVKGEKDKVIEVVTIGYTLKEKLLRPAKVKVGMGN